MQDRIQSSSALPALGQSAGAVLVPTVGSGEARNLTPLAGKVQNHSNPARVELDKTSIVHKPSNTNEYDKIRCALRSRTAHTFIHRWRGPPVSSGEGPLDLHRARP